MSASDAALNGVRLQLVDKTLQHDRLTALKNTVIVSEKHGQDI